MLTSTTSKSWSQKSQASCTGNNKISTRYSRQMRSQKVQTSSQQSQYRKKVRFKKDQKGKGFSKTIEATKVSALIVSQPLFILTIT